jgi:hypothetical protein
MPATVANPAVRPAPTLGKVLRRSHEKWLADLRTALAPALLAEGNRWDRWAAVRLLRDPFSARLEQERQLTGSIPRLDRALLAEIESGYTELERLRARIDLAGRQHVVATTPLATLPRESLNRLTDLE